MPAWRRTKPIIVSLPGKGALVDALRPLAATADSSGPVDLGACIARLRADLAERFFVSPHRARDVARAAAACWPASVEARRSLAADLASGRLDVLGRPVRIGPGHDWNALPLGPGDDIRYRERPHQFEFIVTSACGMLQDLVDPCLVEQTLRSWSRDTFLRKNPAAYDDSLVAVFRSTALTWLAAALPALSEHHQELEALVYRIILADTRFIRRRLGLSAPNNHRLADGFGLWYLGYLFPSLREAPEWRRTGEQLWLAELARQTYSDGGSFEHSVHYHELVLEMLAAYVLLSDRRRLAVPGWVRRRYLAMLRLQAVLAGSSGAAPSVGDAVEDSLFPLEPSQVCGGGWAIHLLARSGAEMPPGFRQAQAGAEKAYWLSGGDIAPRARELSRSEGAMHAFPEAGFFGLPHNGGRDRLVFRTGPARDSALSAGHMHADLLSVYVDWNRTPVIVDSGTYSYREGVPGGRGRFESVRARFMSPEMHNGPFIRGVDSLERGAGEFPRGSPASYGKARAHLRGPGLVWIEARIDGATPYAGLSRGVISVLDRFWLVYDRTRVQGDPEGLMYGLQLAQDVSAVHARPGGLMSLIFGAKTVGLLFSGTAATEPSAESPVSIVDGLVSPGYGRLERATRLEWRRRPDAPLSAFVIGSAITGTEAGRLTVEPSATGVVFRLARDAGSEIVLLGSDSGSTVAGGRQFSGSLLWCRYEQRVPVELAWLNGSRFRDGDRFIQSDAPIPWLRISGGQVRVPAGFPAPSLNWPLHERG